METTGTCQSCGAVGEVFHLPHHQSNNPVMHEYCGRCKFAYEKELAVNEELKQLSATFDPANPHAQNPNDPAVVAQLHAKHHVQLLEKQQDQNEVNTGSTEPEQTVEAAETVPAYVIPEPVIEEAEVVDVQTEQEIAQE